MKKTIYLSGIAAVSLMMASCSLDTENPSSMEGEVIYSTPVLANKVVMGIHQSFGETNSYRGRFIPYFGINTDCEQFNNYGGVSDPTTDKEASLACYSATSTNTYMNTSNNAWAKLYEAIERANMGLQDMEKYGDMTDRDMKHLYGELLTLRGMIYFDLVKAWGDVPYRFEPVTSETTYLPKSSRVKVLQKVLADLKIAENMVYGPNDQTGSEKVIGENGRMTTERVSTTFVHGLRARVALFLAGKSMQTNGALGYNDQAGRDSLYQIAFDECVAGIDGHPTKLTQLPFEQNFKYLCQEKTTGGLESLFEIPFADGRGRVLYTWGGKHAAKDQWTQLAKGGVNGPVPTLWYDYDPNDTRRDITVIPYTWVASDEDGVSIKGTSNLVSAGWSFGKLRFEWMNRTVTSTNDDGINWQVMRLADLYLMAAEAANELGQFHVAKTYLLPVMERAYGSTIASQKIGVEDNYTAIFNLIVDERKFEFAGEAIRKVDLMRWGLLKSKMEETKSNLIELAYRGADDETKAADYPDHTFTGKYDNFPIKIYYNTGMGADANDADSYYVYGLNAGDTDAAGKEAKYENSSYVFSAYWTGSDTADKRKTDIAKVKKYIDSYYLNDPDQKMFWPIWKVFLDSSNGQLTNDYGY